MAAIDGNTDVTDRLMADGHSWIKWAAGAALLGFSLLLMYFTAPDQDFPNGLKLLLGFADAVNQAEVWLRENFRWFTRAISGAVAWGLDHVENFLFVQPWPVIVLIFVLPALAFGSLRLALFCLLGVAFWGSMRMWDSSLETLALMGIAVLLSGSIGIIIGIACAQNDRVEAVVRPVLDLMQTMPAFVYLLPAIFFFGIGGPSAIMATMIYALPPAVRLTNLGIRQVPAETVEAARSFGSTRRQILFKVQLPLAMPSIMMGINQTVMMALGLVVLATLIGARGLGYEVWQALRQLDVGRSLEAGISIVFMAIIFDRISTAMAQRLQTDRIVVRSAFRLLPDGLRHFGPARAIENVIDLIWNGVAKVGRSYAGAIGTILSLAVGLVSRDAARSVYNFVLRHAFFIVGITLIWAVILVDQHLASIGGYPHDWQFSIRAPVTRAVEALTIDRSFIAFTTGIRNATYYYFLYPLDTFLTGLPWWFTIGISGVLIWISAGRNLAIFTVIALFLMGTVGLWGIAMETLAVILVSVAVCLLFGVPIGIASAYSDTLEALLKPVLDTMQTLPTFVYLIPVIMFFGGNIVSAVIATVIYALPPIIRLTSLGVRQVPPQAEEAARSFGSNWFQILIKVKLPLSLPSIMLGVNQAIMMALAMTVVTPLIGGKGLGKEVFDAFNIASSGKGLQAGISIVLLAIILDRLTQVWSRKQRAALGL